MSDQRTSRIKGLLKLLRSPTSKFSLGSLLIVGFAAGIIFWGGFNTVMEWTNTEKFCISCHEMENNVYKEYQHTIHYSNRTGVRAVCSDCHVPQAWGPKMIRKIQASREVWGKITGTINTPEKFEAKRLTLARREWNRMMKNDSLECRNCHDFVSMDKEVQAPRAKRMHERAVADGMTCIQCHQGIAHQLPDDMTDDDYLD